MGLLLRRDSEHAGRRLRIRPWISGKSGRIPEVGLALWTRTFSHTGRQASLRSPDRSGSCSISVIARPVRSNTSKRYTAEVRERAVRLFREHVHEYATRWEAMGSIAGKIGCTTETLRSWVLKPEATADPRRNAALAERERGKWGT